VLHFLTHAIFNTFNSEQIHRTWPLMQPFIIFNHDLEYFIVLQQITPNQNSQSKTLAYES